MSYLILFVMNVFKYLVYCVDDASLRRGVSCSCHDVVCLLEPSQPYDSRQRSGLFVEITERGLLLLQLEKRSLNLTFVCLLC